MKFIPFTKYSLESSLSHEEVIRRLSYPPNGYVSVSKKENIFRLHKGSIIGCNTRPLLWISIENNGFVRIKQHCYLITLIIGLILSFVFAVLSVLFLIFSPDLTSILIVSLGAILTYALLVIPYNWQAPRDKKFIEDLLEAKSVK